MSVLKKPKNIKSAMDDPQSRHIVYGVIGVLVLLIVIAAFI